jgi:hypothetical protein
MAHHESTNAQEGDAQKVAKGTKECVACSGFGWFQGLWRNSHPITPLAERADYSSFPL